MAHVHIKEIGVVTGDRGKVSLIYHIPIGAPVAGIVPTPASSIAAELDPAEIAALAAGTIAELRSDIVALRSQAVADIKAAIKKAWQSAETAYNAEYNFKYKYYGATIADATT